MTVSIDRANADYLPAILELLTRSDLPPEGLSDHLATTLGVISIDIQLFPPVRLTQEAFCYLQTGWNVVYYA